MNSVPADHWAGGTPLPFGVPSVLVLSCGKTYPSVLNLVCDAVFVCVHFINIY